MALRIIKLAVVVLISLLGLRATAQMGDENWFNQTRIAEIDTFISDRMAKTGTVGLAVVLVEDGEIVHSRGFGLLERGGASVDADTIFAVGSVSKSFTGQLAAQLMAEGLIDANVPATEILPSWDGSRAHHTAISLRRALNHQTGYTQAFGNIGARAQEVSDIALGETVAALSEKPPQNASGEAFEYSNVNYKIAGRMIEIAGGAPFHELIEARIFQVAGMTRAYVNNPNTANQATPHIYWGSALVPTRFHAGRAVDPAANIYASANDMGLYLIALMKPQGEPGSLWHPVFNDTSVTGLEGRTYSFGWEREARDNMTVLHHHGLNPGYSATAAFSPDARIGFAILNAAGQGQLAGDNFSLNGGVFDLAFGKTPKSPMSYLTNWILMTICAVLTLALIGWLIWLTRLVLTGKRKQRDKPTKVYGLGVTILNLGLALIATAVLYIIPNAVGAPLSTIWLYNPDVGLVFSILGGAALTLLLGRQVLFITDRWMNAQY